MARIRLRFVRNTGWKYNVVAWREGVCMPFAPTHAEYLTEQNTCIGQHGHIGGIREMPFGYDRDEIYVLPNGRRCELVVELPATEAQVELFDDFLRDALTKREPYDWSAPWGFLLGGRHHQKFHSTCSAKMFLALRHCGWFPWPTTIPAHEIDPAMLLWVLSTHVEVPH